MTDPTEPAPAAPSPAGATPAGATPAGATPAGATPAPAGPAPPGPTPSASADARPGDATPAEISPADHVPAASTEKVGSAAASTEKVGSAAASTEKVGSAAASTEKVGSAAASTEKVGSAAASDASPPAAGTVGKPPAGARRALLPAGVLLVVAIGGLIAFGLNSPKSHTRLPGNVGETPAGGSFAGGTLVPAKAAPATTLRNYLGQTVSLSQYRGKVVFVTFLYTHCPDVCPLIATNLHATQAALGAANDKVQMIAISVDPKGDTPKAVANFLRVHNLLGRMQYLVGSSAELGRVWAAWNVGSAQDAASPALVDHSALVYGITAKGALTTIYPAQFKPSDLVHDTPLLLAR